MKKYDIIIVGCGISCLYFLSLCRARNLRICILEKSSRVGGRISLGLHRSRCTPHRNGRPPF